MKLIIVTKPTLAFIDLFIMATIWLVKYVRFCIKTKVVTSFENAVVTSLFVIKLSKELPWLDKRDNSLTTWDNTWKWWLTGAVYAQNVLEVKSNVQVHFSVTGKCSNESVDTILLIWFFMKSYEVSCIFLYLHFLLRR